MDIRFATIDDIELIIKLRTLQLEDEAKQYNSSETVSCDYLKHMYRYLLNEFNKERFIQVFIEEDNYVIATGALMWTDFPPSFTNPTGYLGYITNMYTDVNYRRQAYATKVLNILKNEAEKRGIQTLFLGASKSGQMVYKKFGFSEIDWYRFDI